MMQTPKELTTLDEAHYTSKGVKIVQIATISIAIAQVGKEK
jgi:hypothetical protein